jgi:hypothetical protein
MHDVFDQRTVAELTERINRLTPASAPQWGKMSADQMLAHCNVSYDMAYTDTYPPANAVMRVLLNLFVRKGVVGPKPYPRNSPTAPAFKVAGPRDFEQEKRKLLDYLERVQRDGRTSFNGRPSPSFGPLSAAEWNTLFYKHLDHHLTQFGV